MKTILSIIFISVLTLSAVFGQEVRFINLEYSSAARLDNARVKVHISRDPDNAYSVRVESLSLRSAINPSTLKPENKPKEQKITITEEQFRNLVTSLDRIKPIDIINGPHPIFLDGSSCYISYGANGTGVTYYVKTPNHDTGKRNLNDFLDAYKLILRTADLDPEKIL
ncbi:hypothetical protein [Pontibacter indicus]|uniref:Uncharacterized protein n=1 Tax=Pontibacter indicus TaxID=1317125 RepID=A0A1R3XBM5_9BACT|nr:hypothetical protein [Pontibacter indicus]SIT88551.1 hypothetical protein SAMN05444128_1863 [Pontibacter indicus]